MVSFLKQNLCQDSLFKYDFKTAVGVRGGFTMGINIRHFFDEKGRAAEILFGKWPDAFGVTFLLEKFKPTDVRGFHLYYGGGVHYTYGNNRNYYTTRNGRKFLYKYPGSEYSFGIDGCFGVEYKIPKVPIIINTELKPLFEFGSNADSYLYLDPALGLRISF